MPDLRKLTDRSLDANLMRVQATFRRKVRACCLLYNHIIPFIKFGTIKFSSLNDFFMENARAQYFLFCEALHVTEYN